MPRVILPSSCVRVKKRQLSLDQNVLQALQATDEPLSGIEQSVDPALTLFNLLHMDSGFEFVETYDPGDDATQMLYDSSAMWRAAPENGHEYPPEGWQREATQPSPANWQGNYGLSFWLNTEGSQFPSLPKSMFNAGGNAGQRVMVFPDHELVIVRLGLTQSGVDQGVELFSRQVLDSLEH